jgi:hypothetical protein
MDIAPVADFDNLDGEHIVLNGINDAIISLPNPITLLTGKLFTTRRSRIFFKKINAIDEALEVLLGNRVKAPYDGSFKIDLIFGHCV